MFTQEIDDLVISLREMITLLEAHTLNIKDGHWALQPGETLEQHAKTLSKLKEAERVLTKAQ